MNKWSKKGEHIYKKKQKCIMEVIYLLESRLQKQKYMRYCAKKIYCSLDSHQKCNYSSEANFYDFIKCQFFIYLVW